MQGNDALTESVVLLTKQFVKLKNQFHKHMGSQRNNREDQALRQSRISNASLGYYRKKDHERGKGSEVSKSDKGIRCHECEGFGHIQAERATYLKRKKKVLVATFFDEEDYSESDNEEPGMALISICTMNDEVDVQTHDQLESKNLTDDETDIKKTEDQEIILQQQERIQDLVEENQSFLSSIVTLKEELAETKHQFEDLLKFARMLTNGISKLDDILDQGRRFDDKRGLRFAERDTPVRKTTFIREGSLQNSPTNNDQGRENCKVALTSIKSPNSRDSYFDSGCFRHMIGNADFFSELSESKASLSKVEEDRLWHKRLGHLSGATISKVTKADAIIGLPLLSFSSLESCSECPAGKQVKSVHKPVNIFSTSHILELLQ
ncbi:gag-pol polyprotein [Cucumis melo var. makuwa]|uniref:Gag-pol polyprotein n=1 Tax=Cucumis melo var. makuwa TaxID=1194695 RepID=A0A5D3DFH8_CUCMM|nr:gag-pol polyprotein [Cucumis melo var. makuwa]TYK22305.1 gag-pol polyprotein [Cucumis melo var. makuwa]